MTMITQATVSSPRRALNAARSPKRGPISRPKVTDNPQTAAAVAWIKAMRADGFVFVRRHLQEGVNDFAIRRQDGEGRDDTSQLINLMKLI
ncbi:MAG: hypothetical protein LCH88_17310 [Proteobacteria bacterium]|nr:hypothetical protein [Pseudomonadota bacterium]